MIQGRTLGLALGVAAAISVATGCSGSSDGSPGSGASGPPPIVLGFANMEGSPAGSFPEARVGAQAAVDQVNDAGGVGGRPIELSVCKTNGTAESSQGCAQKLLADKPLAVVGGVDLGANASVHVIADAGVPYVTGSPTLGAELTTPGVSAFTGGTAAELLGIGDYLIAQHVKSIHVLHEDLPGLLTTAINAAGSIFTAKGVTDVKLVPEKADAADFAPALTAAAAGKPDAIIVVFPAQACARIMQAAQALSVKAPLYYPGACASPAVVNGREAALGSSFFASGFLPVAASGGGAEGDAFRKRVPVGQRSPVSMASYAAVLDVTALMADGGTDRASLAKKLAATHDQAGVLAHPYTCDGKQLPLLISVCNSNVRLLQYRGGAFTDVAGRWVNGGELAGLASPSS